MMPYIIAVCHDVLELVVDLISRPCESLTVLSHLQTRDGDATTVGCLCSLIRWGKWEECVGGDELPGAYHTWPVDFRDSSKTSIASFVQPYRGEK